MNSLALLPNIMGPDGLIIFLFILLFFGAKRLPELAKGLGSAVREFSKAKDEIEHEITRAPTPRIEAPAETKPYYAPAATEPDVVRAAEIIPPATPVAPATEEMHQRPEPPVA